MGRRTAVVRHATRPTLVLGSTQPPGIVDADRAARAGVQVLRRRSGGGAVLLGPTDHWWFDLWLPRADPLWDDDVVRSSGWVGIWWAGALIGAGVSGVTVHRAAQVTGVASSLVCFAGVGPGEVLVAGRKLTGVAQWRSREGALVHSLAYRRWDPGPLLDVLDIRAADRVPVAESLAPAATDLDSVVGPGFTVDDLLRHLPDAPGWDVRSR